MFTQPEPVHPSLYLGDVTLPSWLIFKSNWSLVSEQLMCKFCRNQAKMVVALGTNLLHSYKALTLEVLSYDLKHGI